MAHYSKIDYRELPEQTYWNNIELSPRTVHERKKIKWGIDDFASFTWRGIDAFETFGAFIINNKDSLKFYNGPSFSNEYTKPQFETAAGQLTGVTFQIQKIDFTMGVYWISEEHYRQMIYWLHPYEINTLTFGFEPNYYYQVKLASIDNGNRYIVGYEDNKPMYYTEMKVTFELQGPPVAYGNTYFNFKSLQYEGNFYKLGETENRYNTIECYSQLDSEHDKRQSDLETPIILETTIFLDKIIPFDINKEVVDDLVLSAYVQYENQEQQQLFSVNLQNVNFGTHLDETNNRLNITYNSESALLFLQHGDSMRELLTKLTTSTSGDRLVNFLTVDQFRIPGTFDDYEFDLSKIKIWYKLIISNQNYQFNITDNAKLEDYFIARVYSRPRTNLI